jgi:hypothetical protein
VKEYREGMQGKVRIGEKSDESAAAIYPQAD